jgi:D-alanyl-D-alanine carboxypeptidase-like protein
MSELSDRVPIPPKDTMNTGLSPAKQSTMLNKLGRPGALTKDCSDPSAKFKERIKFSVNVGPFKVSGLDFAVESLRQIFAEVQIALPAVFDEVKTEGMLCVRARRKAPQIFSNHSFGTAVDLFFGNKVVDQGVHLAHRGNFLLFPFFNRHGWYWGAEFSGDFVDSMHFELAEETILKLPDTPL